MKNKYSVLARGNVNMFLCFSMWCSFMFIVLIFDRMNLLGTSLKQSDEVVLAFLEKSKCLQLFFRRFVLLVFAFKYSCCCCGICQLELELSSAE